ncbi:MAG TPA: phytanoyl-CoA dioxygenase family protein [Solirubrobacteraceae bacterium]
MLGQVVNRDAAKEAFDRDGFLVFDPGIPAKTIDRAVADVEGASARRWTPFARRRHRVGDVGRVTDAWASSAAVKAIALAPDVLGMLHALYGRHPLPFQTLNFKYGTEQRPHADAVHFNTEPPGLMCGVWVAMEDIDADCGPLVYYPGSQRLPFASPSEVGIQVDPAQQAVSHEEYQARYEPYIEQLIDSKDLEPLYATLSKGQAVIWAANLLHGGSPVRVPGRTRRSQVTHYYFEGARLWTPLLSSDARKVWREAPLIT